MQELESLWAKSLGDPNICIAVLDGSVDQSHPCFQEANLTRLPTLISGNTASYHGTHVTSIIFGNHNSVVKGIAPSCRGLIVPIFNEGKGDQIYPCSQVDLARAITQAVQAGANVINISGGQLTSSPESDRLLDNAIRLCQEKNVLIVAAAGNDGCECLHVPASLESVLAVGAMDSQGNPLDFSNWGKTYQNQGILAIGENILGAIPDGGTSLKSGTSFATPIVSGIVALLLSIQLQKGEKPDPHSIRDAILKSALPCNLENNSGERRCLVGSINISGAYTLIIKGGIKPLSNEKSPEYVAQSSEIKNISQELTNQINNHEREEFLPIEAINANFPQVVTQSAMGIQAAEAKTPTVMPTHISVNPMMMVSQGNRANASISPSGAKGGCGCGGGGSMQLVYALGQLGTDFGTETRKDSFMQLMPNGMSLLDYLNLNPFEAQSLIWTLNLDATPIYAIMPAGPYANVTYDRLREFLADENAEHTSVPGYIGGTIRLMSGQVVPVIVPEVRGMYNWSVEALLDELLRDGVPQGITREILRDKIREVLDRIYYDFRNLGTTSEERALNYAVTNAYQLSVAISAGSQNDQVLDTIDVEKSPICRPDSDCYDVKLRFFNPENNQRAKKIYRFTIDVSDVMPVTIGRMRSWSES